jgi:hypothetical protein
VVPGAPEPPEPARPPPGNRSLDSPAEPRSRPEVRGHGRGATPDRFGLSVPSGPVGGRATTAPSGLEEPVRVPASDESVLRPRPRRLAWAELLRRVFAVDVLDCPRCGGRMRLPTAIHPPDVTQAILDCLELPSRAPPAAPAVPDPEERAGDFEASVRGEDFRAEAASWRAREGRCVRRSHAVRGRAGLGGGRPLESPAYGRSRLRSPGDWT